LLLAQDEYFSARQNETKANCLYKLTHGYLMMAGSSCKICSDVKIKKMVVVEASEECKEEIDNVVRLWLLKWEEHKKKKELAAASSKE